MVGLLLVMLGGCADNEAGAFGPPFAYAEAPQPTSHDFTSWEGRETFQYAENLDEPGARNCVLDYTSAGVAMDLDPSCVGCTFAFEVSLQLDPDLSIDDGSCAALQAPAPFVYAYASDWYGDGQGWLLAAYYGTWDAIAQADLEGDSFVYAGGYQDYEYVGSFGYYPDYYGTWQTFYLAGTATVR